MLSLPCATAKDDGTYCSYREHWLYDASVNIQTGLEDGKLPS